MVAWHAWWYLYAQKVSYVGDAMMMIMTVTATIMMVVIINILCIWKQYLYMICMLTVNSAVDTGMLHYVNACL